MRVVRLSHSADAISHEPPPRPPVVLCAPPQEGAQEPSPLARLALPMRSETWLEAPCLFEEGEARVPPIDVETAIGVAAILRFPEKEARSLIVYTDIAPYSELLRETGIALIYTGWDRRFGESDYFFEHPTLTLEAAELIKECGVRLLGVDFPSVDRYPYPIHYTLLGGGVMIAENLTNLETLVNDQVEFLGIPMREVGRDGAPLRAIAIDL